MRKKIAIPRIIKIEKIDGLTVQCMFNNGESRKLDFGKILDKWDVSEHDIEWKLRDTSEFKKVGLRNFTLSWDNLVTQLIDEDGKEQAHPYEIGPDILYDLSESVDSESFFKFGTMIRKARLHAGMTQEELAMRSGTSRFYISRLENNRTDVELSTFRKIVEAGLGKNLRLMIE